MNSAHQPCSLMFKDGSACLLVSQSTTYIRSRLKYWSYKAPAWSDTRKVLQFSTAIKNSTIFKIQFGINESLVMICVWMWQNREACSYPLYSAVSAGTAGMLSPHSTHAVFIATKNRGMCKYKRSWPCMRFVVKGDAWSETWHNFAYISDSKDRRWGTRIQHYKPCGMAMVWNDSHLWSLKGLWSPIPPLPSKIESK